MMGTTDLSSSAVELSLEPLFLLSVFPLLRGHVGAHQALRCKGVCRVCVCAGVCVQRVCAEGMQGSVCRRGVCRGVCVQGVCAGCVWCGGGVQGEGVHRASRAGGTHFSPAAQAREQLTSQCSPGKGGNVWPVCTGA